MGRAGLGSVCGRGQTQTHRALLDTASQCCHPSWLPGVLEGKGVGEKGGLDLLISTVWTVGGGDKDGYALVWTVTEQRG